MSYSWTCEGSGFSAFKWALEVAGVPTEPIWLGEHSDEAISFTAADGRRMVAEDYLSVDDGDCDGTSRYEFVLYEEGQRPELMREVRCGGGSFGSEYSLSEGEPLDHFEFRINDGAIFPCPGTAASDVVRSMMMTTSSTTFLERRMRSKTLRT